jgi:hypothetical protein
MSLPACQQRALDRMEGALRASEPHLTSMYAIFTRLNAHEPVGTERLVRKRLRLLQQGTALYAIVLLPVMFAAIIVGALLSGSARSATACEAGYSVGGVSPLILRPACPVPGQKTAAKTAAAMTKARKTVPATTRLVCSTTAPAARFTALAGYEQAFSPPAPVDATAVGPPGRC